MLNWMIKFKNQKGFSLPEAMIGILIMGGVGVAGMKLAQNMKTGTVAVKGSNDLNRTMMEIRNLLSNPKVCNDNLSNKREDQVMGGIIDTSNPVQTSERNQGEREQADVQNTLMKFASGTNVKVANGNYIISGIKISKVDPLRKRAFVAFTFENTDSKGVITKITKNVGMFVNATGNRIDDCVNPAELSADAITEKLCYDADPLNFDVDPDNNNTICSDNMPNLKAQVKKLYCESHPFFKYAGGKCLPLDSGVDCGSGSFVKGYDGTGKAICYPAPTAPSIPLPTGCVDSTWTPSDRSQVCVGTYVTETSNCNNSRPSTTVQGTKSDSSCVSCSDTSWSLASDPGDVCSSAFVTEISNCNNNRPSTVRGTRDCSACTDTTWTPDTSNVCTTASVTQTSNCNNTRTVPGTKNCVACQIGRPGIWNDSVNPNMECREIYTYGLYPMAEGEEVTMNANACRDTSGRVISAECYGVQTVKCVNGSHVIIESICNTNGPI